MFSLNSEAAEMLQGSNDSNTDKQGDGAAAGNISTGTNSLREGTTPMDYMRSVVVNLSDRISNIEKKIKKVDNILKD